LRSEIQPKLTRKPHSPFVTDLFNLHFIMLEEESHTDAADPLS
jgi:hypothetical protein